jgi:cbb3-type cytochrome oxidase subunit 3
MIPSRAELLRRRRCRLLAFGMVLGALLPVFQWSWITLAVGLGGIAVLLFVYRRECRGEVARESTQDDTHTRGAEP